MEHLSNLKLPLGRKGDNTLTMHKRFTFKATLLKGRCQKQLQTIDTVTMGAISNAVREQNM